MASLPYLIGPMLGGILYITFGLRPVMYASAAFFLFDVLGGAVYLILIPTGLIVAALAWLAIDFERVVV